MRLDAFDWHQGSFSVPQRKNGQSDRLPLDKATGEAVAAYLRDGRPESSSPFLFLSVTAPHRPMTSPGVGQVARRVMRRAGIRHRPAGGHTFRHSVVSHLVEAGLPYPSIAQFVGHAVTQTTRRYGRIDVERLRRVALAGGEGAL